MIGRIETVKHRNIALKTLTQNHAVTLKCVVWFGALDWKHSLSQKSPSPPPSFNISLGFPNRRGAWGSGRMGNQPQKWLQVFKLWNKCKDMGVSENSGFSPQIIHFNRVFHYKPSILGVPPIFGNTHMFLLKKGLWIPWRALPHPGYWLHHHHQEADTLHVYRAFWGSCTKPPTVTRFRIPKGYDFYTPET